MDFGAMREKIDGYIDLFKEKLQTTGLAEQFRELDYIGLLTNPWFYVPFGLLLLYMIYKKAFRNIIIMFILIGLWFVWGTDYMQSLVVGDQLQVSKVLPVLFGGAAAVGFIIYLLFGRSD